MPVLPDIGDVFSGCQIIARCGNGAYGITFLARNPLGQKVIIKIVGNLNSGERELTGLRNYMLVAGKHPSLLQIYHIGEHENGFYYTMEAADNISDIERDAVSNELTMVHTPGKESIEEVCEFLNTQAVNSCKAVIYQRNADDKYIVLFIISVGCVCEKFCQTSKNKGFVW